MGSWSGCGGLGGGGCSWPADEVQEPRGSGNGSAQRLSLSGWSRSSLVLQQQHQGTQPLDVQRASSILAFLFPSPYPFFSFPLVACCPQECKKLLEEKFKTGKNRWFFSKLRF
jgi:hypothetical protein